MMTPQAARAVLLALCLALSASCRVQPSAPTPSPLPPASATATTAPTLLPGVIETATALAAAALASPTSTRRASPSPSASPTAIPPTETPTPTTTPEAEAIQLPPGCQAEHVVQPGEWLGLIARTYGVALAELASANGIANTNQLVVGQALCIPAPGATAVAPGTDLAILEFAASPNPVERGNVVGLRWTVRAADRVSLWRLAFDSQLNQWFRTQDPVYRGPGSGELTLPVALDARQPLRFELEASNAASQTITLQTEPIQLACYPAFFNPAPDPASCRHAPLNLPAELQAFEHGYMLWRSDTEEIYVFPQLPDQYLSWSIQLPNGQPVEVGLAPAGLLAPGFRFSEVWAAMDAGQLGGTGRLRDALGWALGPVERFDLTLQVRLDARFSMFDQVFISWPDGRIAQLFTGGGLPRPGLVGPAWSFIAP
jgi:LysM repeat protein